VLAISRCREWVGHPVAIAVLLLDGNLGRALISKEHALLRGWGLNSKRMLNSRNSPSEKVHALLAKGNLLLELGKLSAH
jgi:hypothetical protein